MPVYIYETDAFEKMVEMEGEEYRRFKDKEVFGICSFDAFLEAWQRECADNPRMRNHTPEFGISVDGNGAIYGLGGWHRYAVLNSGEIAFIEMMSTPEKIEKAKKIGFRIW